MDELIISAILLIVVFDVFCFLMSRKGKNVFITIVYSTKSSQFIIN